MSERRPNGAPVILRMCADILEERDELQAQLEAARTATTRAAADGLREICRLDALVWQTADEAAALASDLDDLQAEWAASHAANLDIEQSFRELVAALEKERDSARGYAAALEHDFGRLTTKAVEDLKAEIAQLGVTLSEESRLRRVAFERNAELEREMKSCAQTLRVIVAENIASPDLLGLASRLDPPHAPSVPRHRFVESEAPL